MEGPCDVVVVQHVKEEEAKDDDSSGRRLTGVKDSTVE